MRLIASSLLAGLIAVTAVAPAFADQRGRGRDHDRGRDRGYDRDHRDGYRGDAYRGGRHDDRRGGHRGGWQDDRGGRHNWGQGDYFSYRPRQSNFMVVQDYNRYRLPPPRQGQHYYRDSNTGEILLIAAATGLVLWAMTQ